MTEADKLLYQTLLRHDYIYYYLYKLNFAKSFDFTNIARYEAELKQIPDIANSIQIEDENVGIVIEVKYAEDGNLEKACENALNQIVDRRYAEALEQEDIHTILKYGIACYKKKCRVVMAIAEI